MDKEAEEAEEVSRENKGIRESLSPPYDISLRSMASVCIASKEKVWRCGVCLRWITLHEGNRIDIAVLQFLDTDIAMCCQCY